MTHFTETRTMIKDLRAHPNPQNLDQAQMLEDRMKANPLAPENGPHVIPGVLLAEQVAQSALLMARLRGLAPEGETLVLSQLRCDFLASAEPPAAILANVSFRAGFGHFGFMGSCSDGQTELARIKGMAFRRAPSVGK